MKIILVDTFGFFFRSYYALPPLHNSKHFPTSLLTGFANFIFNLYKDNPHTCIIFTLEGQGTNRRKEFYPQYKANRKEVPQDLLLQLPIAITWLEAMRLPTLSLEGYEADDCIATLATLAKNQGFLVEIISHDKDLYQLIDDSIYIFDYAKRQNKPYKELPSVKGGYRALVGDTTYDYRNVDDLVISNSKGIPTLEDFKAILQEERRMGRNIMPLGEISSPEYKARLVLACDEVGIKPIGNIRIPKQDYGKLGLFTKIKYQKFIDKLDKSLAASRAALAAQQKKTR